jgi:hypothetical protein
MEAIQNTDTIHTVITIHYVANHTHMKKFDGRFFVLGIHLLKYSMKYIDIGVSIAVTMESIDFCGVMQCSLVNILQNFGEIFCFLLHRNEVVGFSDMLIIIYHITYRATL